MNTSGFALRICRLVPKREKFNPTTAVHTYILSDDKGILFFPRIAHVENYYTKTYYKTCLRYEYLPSACIYIVNYVH